MSKVIPKIFRINTGSCNGCDVEFVASAFVDKFGLTNLEFELVEDVKDANLLVITGPLTARSESFFKKSLSLVKKPFAVVGVGTCSISSGIFKDSYAIYGPVDKYVDVDINIAGCPPRPQSIAEGIAKGIKVLEQKLKGEAPKKIDKIFTDFTAPESFRGRVTLDQDLCTACRTCETVCPSNAIKITKTENGDFIHKIWHNTCCYCGNCAFFCPTGAISLTNDFDTAKHSDEKYTDVNTGYIYQKECAECGELFKSATKALIKRAYKNSKEEKFNPSLCPSCRKEANFKRIYS